MNVYSAQILKNIFWLKDTIHFVEAKSLLTKPRPEKWSKKEILGHLIDSARYNLQRFNEIPLSEKTYQINSYPQVGLVKLNDYQNADLQELIMTFQLLNRQICKAIDRLSDENMKIEIQAYGEKKDLHWLIKDYVEHLEHHLKQILSDSDTKAPKNFSYHLSLKKAQSALAEAPTEFLKLTEFGDLEIEYYKPNKVDKQKPHDRDELYIISKGQGEFLLEDQKFEIKTNDLLFVKAQDEHRFVNFSDDFETWVIFYGIKRERDGRPA